MSGPVGKTFFAHPLPTGSKEAGLNKFECWWDYEKMQLTVKLSSGQQLHYTQEFLQDTTGSKLIQHILGTAKAMTDLTKPQNLSIKASGTFLNAKKPKKNKAWNIATLCLPGMRNRWKSKTEGTINSPPFDAGKTIDFEMSQGFTLKLPREIFKNERYHHIDVILDWLAKHWSHLKHIVGYDFTVQDGTCYELEFDWSLPKEFKVYDLDGMLVPCELAHEIVQWIGKENLSTTWISQEIVEDDMYGQDMTKVLQSKVDQLLLEKHAKMAVLYPGKIMLLDDPVKVSEVSPYLTNAKQWFIDPSLGSNSLLNADMIEKLLAVQTAPVALPKKPKQITKESLEHFHKLLGGKKDPYIK